MTSALVIQGERGRVKLSCRYICCPDTILATVLSSLLSVITLIEGAKLVCERGAGSKEKESREGWLMSEIQ
jgi:hypothetical protein